jgi:pectate lyase
MHGDDGMVGIAGDEIVVRNNDFHATRAVEAKTRNPGGEYPAIQIRGSPETGVWVEDNRFVHESREEAYYQTDGPHRVTFDGNTYGWTPEGDWDDPKGNLTNATNQRWWPVDW